MAGLRARIREHPDLIPAGERGILLALAMPCQPRRSDNHQLHRRARVLRAAKGLQPPIASERIPFLKDPGKKPARPDG